MSSRFNRSAWWLLALLPGDVLIALDLERGVYRPLVWLARFLPAFIVLALVGWAEFSGSPTATRLRKDLAVVLPLGLLLLLVSGTALLVDALPSLVFLNAINGITAPLTGVLTLAVVILPFAAELTHETWAALRVSPLGSRAVVEKFALSAGLVVLAWLQSGSSRSEPELFGLACCVVALAFSLGAFRVLKHALSALLASLTLAVAITFGIEMRAELPAVAAVVGLSGAALVVLTLLTLPRWWSQLPLAEEQLRAHMSTARSLSRVSWPWRAELEPLRMVVWLPLLSLAGSAVLMFDSGDGALTTFIGCASAALISPGIVFSEARRAGTLDHVLSVQPVGAVFRRKVIAAAGFTALASVVLPLCGFALLERLDAHWLHADDARAAWPQLAGATLFSWSLSMAFLFSVGLLVALRSRHAAIALFVAGALAIALALAQIVVAQGSAALTHVLVYSGDWFGGLLDGPHLAATFVGTTALLLALAWWQFSDDRRVVRKTALGISLCLAQATTIAVIGPLLPRW